MSRALAYGAAWWVLVEGRFDAWVAGAIAIILALGARHLLGRVAAPATVRIRVPGLLRFVPFFLWESVRGGTDVARRALHRRLPISPALIAYPLTLRTRPARVFFVDAVSLAPGMFVAEWSGDTVFVHVLDASVDVSPRLRAIEMRIAATLGEPPIPPWSHESERPAPPRPGPPPPPPAETAHG